MSTFNFGSYDFCSPTSSNGGGESASDKGSKGGSGEELLGKDTVLCWVETSTCRHLVLRSAGRRACLLKESECTAESHKASDKLEVPPEGAVGVKVFGKDQVCTSPLAGIDNLPLGYSLDNLDGAPRPARALMTALSTVPPALAGATGENLDALFKAEDSDPLAKAPGRPQVHVDTTAVKNMLEGYSGLVELACATPTGDSAEDNQRWPMIREGMALIEGAVMELDEQHAAFVKEVDGGFEEFTQDWKDSLGEPKTSLGPTVWDAIQGMDLKATQRNKEMSIAMDGLADFKKDARTTQYLGKQVERCDALAKDTRGGLRDLEGKMERTVDLIRPLGVPKSTWIPPW